MSFDEIEIWRRKQRRIRVAKAIAAWLFVAFVAAGFLVVGWLLYVGIWAIFGA